MWTALARPSLRRHAGTCEPVFESRPGYFIFITRARAQADTASEISTSATMESKIAATRSVSIWRMLRFRYQPMPPAPKKPTTVAARKDTSQV